MGLRNYFIWCYTFRSSLNVSYSLQFHDLTLFPILKTLSPSFSTLFAVIYCVSKAVLIKESCLRLWLIYSSFCIDAFCNVFPERLRCLMFPFHACFHFIYFLTDSCFRVYCAVHTYFYRVSVFMEVNSLLYFSVLVMFS